MVTLYTRLVECGVSSIFLAKVRCLFQYPSAAEKQNKYKKNFSDFGEKVFCTLYFSAASSQKKKKKISTTKVKHGTGLLPSTQLITINTQQVSFSQLCSAQKGFQEDPTHAFGSSV